MRGKIMFHRPKNDTDQTEIQQQGNTPKPQNNDMNDKSAGNNPESDQSRTINQNTTITTKDQTTMNTTPQNQTNASDNKDQQNSTPAQGQNQQTASSPRVDIPGGNNFSRPGIPNQSSRPSYPGMPGSAGGYGTSSSSDLDSKLMIGKGITLSGDIESCDHLIVDGTVEATLRGGSQLDISENGAFIGTVEIENADIAGRFEGDITVSGRLTVQATGNITGTISYKELAIEVGAQIDGTISPIGSANQKKSAAPIKSKKASQDNSAELPFSGAKTANA